MALIYKHLGDLEQGKEYQQRALKIKLDKLGPEHVDVATSYNILASIYQDLGDLEQAKEYQQRALKITLDKLGPEHADVATSDNNRSNDDGVGNEDGNGFACASRSFCTAIFCCCCMAKT